MDIRDERAADSEGIRLVNQRAFETEAEARLVDRLRDEDSVLASIVASEGERIVGHALFSPAVIDYGEHTTAIGALGPVAVVPARQRSGIGAAVIRAGIARCWALGLPAIVVLGHPAYYGRFGFMRADRWEIRCEFEAPPEAFMIAWAAASVPGPAVARYHRAFFQV